MLENVINRLILQVIVGVLGFFLAIKFIPGIGLEVIPGKSQFFGIGLTTNWQILVLVGSVLGLINFFIKPVLKIITLPLRILTLGLFGFIINMVMVWIVDILFPELVIQGLLPLFWTTIIIWGMSFVLGLSRLK